MLSAKRMGSVLLAVVLLLAACSTTASESPSAESAADESDKKPVTELPPGYPEEGSREYAEIDQVFYVAGAVVEGEVLDVRGPYWNREDGTYWTVHEYPGSFASPTLYREVDLLVTGTYRDEIGLDEVVTMSVGGTGFDWEINHGGEFTEGETVVVALIESYQLFLEGPEDRIYPVGGPAGVFDVVGESLVSQAPIVQKSAGSREDLAATLTAARAVDHPEWDHLRYPPSAAEQLKAMEESAARRRAENEQLEADPENVCNWIGDEQRAKEWLERHPERELTVEILMDPQYAATACGIPVPEDGEPAP